MKRLHIILLSLGLLTAAVSAEGQNVSPVDFMKMNPYQMKANPAADLPYQSVMSLVIGNIGLDVQNTTLRYDNLFEFDAQGRPALLDLRKFANSMQKNNYLGFDANIDLFTLYRRLDKGMLTINYGIKAHGDAVINDGLFKLIGYGNGAFVGEDNLAIVNMDMNVLAYHELAVGYQWNVTDQLSLGGRAKLLFGTGNVTTDAFDVKLFTNPDNYALRLEENVAARMSMPGLFYADGGQLMTDGAFSIGQLFRNPGFGVDLAAEYRFNEHFGAVAAVRDLGFIHWGKENIQVKGNIHDEGQFYDDGNFLFEGIDQLQQIVSDDSYREQFMDTLTRYFRIEFDPMEAYNTALNTNVMLRGYVDINPSNRFSAQVQGCFLGSGFRPAATLAYSGSFFRMLDVCASYTVMPESYDNIGVGLAGNFGTFHIYLTTNNILGYFKPLNASATNAQVGIVFNL